MQWLPCMAVLKTAVQKSYTGGGVGSSTGEQENIVNDINSGVAEVWAGTAGHNCGGRCVTRAVKKNGKIVRILTDERAYDKTFENEVSNPQSRACSRCRSYVGRLYSPSRMKYPLKQTKKRGDLTGFVRITWEQAMKEIAQRYNAILQKYGPEAIYNHMSSGQQGPFQRGGGNGSSSVFAAAVGPLSGGYLHQGYNYSAHSSSYFGTTYTGAKGSGNTTQLMQRNTGSLFLWGSHMLSSSNPYAYSAILSAQTIRNNGGKVWHMSPTLEDTGITLATDWVQLNPLTDVALITAIIYDMIDNTFNADGSIKEDAYLDVDYLDTMVYGFFASPEYWIDKATGTISLTSVDGYTKVEAVLPGHSYADYIMGQDPRLSQAAYGTAINGKINYNSNIFGQSEQNVRGGKCQLGQDTTAVSTSKYYYKQYLREAKSPEWAEKICGVPAETIRAMAKDICDKVKAGKGVLHHCSNGWQRNAEGVNYLFALQNLSIISKGWGVDGAGFYQAAAYNAKYDTDIPNLRVNTANSEKASYANTVPKLPSCTMWHAGVKFAFADALKASGYTGKHVPDMDMNNFKNGYAYADDANIKSFVKHKSSTTFANSSILDYINGGHTSAERYEVGADGYYVVEMDGDKPLYSGIRFVYTAAGNAIVNQHMNSNDTTEMLEHLPFYPDDPANAEGFCYIALDTNFSPTMRWADYALPGTANWEMTDIIGGAGASKQIYMPKVIDGPGESKSTFEMNKLLAKYLVEIDGGYYAGLNSEFASRSDTPNSLIEQGFNNNTQAKDRWGSFEAYQKDGYILGKPVAVNDVASLDENAILTAFNNYKNSDMQNTPFITYAAGTNVVITTFNGESCRTGTSNDYKHYIVDTNDPKMSYRFHVLSDVMVWEYKHRNEKFHGYLPVEERGNKNTDDEGDPIVYNIPVIFDYRDYFNQAYGQDLFADANNKPFFNLGTHIRYRSHSTFNDSPLVRELGKFAIGGGPATDTDLYADVLPVYADVNPPYNTALTLKRLTPVGQVGCGYEAIWMNPSDALSKGINDGDLVTVWNPIGAVHAVAKLSNRISKGVTLMPQGGWYDPDANGIDDGGCSNTLCASTPTRCDHGNAQMSIVVFVTKA